MMVPPDGGSDDWADHVDFSYGQLLDLIIIAVRVKVLSYGEADGTQFHCCSVECSDG